MFPRARLFFVATACFVVSFLLVGCGGRASRPVAVNTPYDDRLDCAHLQAEKSVNATRAHDLLGEQHNDLNNSLGFLVWNPLFIDLSDSEQQEIRAFAAREKVLDTLIAQRCHKP